MVNAKFSSHHLTLASLWASGVSGQRCKNAGFLIFGHPAPFAGAQQHDSLPLTKPPGTHFLLHIFIPFIHTRPEGPGGQGHGLPPHVLSRASWPPTPTPAITQ